MGYNHLIHFINLQFVDWLSPLCKSDRSVPPQRVWVLGLLDSKTGIDQLVWNKAGFSRELGECMKVFVV